MTDPISEHSDFDPQETAEWLESLDAVVAHDGSERGAWILDRVMDRARRLGVSTQIPIDTDYVNSIPAERDLAYPGDLAIERRLRQIIRWNAAMMVSQANKRSDGIGGHMSTYASSATFLEVGFNHIFRGKEGSGRGDHVYFQGHGSPGIYARAFLEGRFELEHLENFRREVDRGEGLSSYPHPRLMPEFWEYPTVSMGLGPLNAIYQARFNRYLHARGIVDTSESQVFCFMGDGECDEPESLGALAIAAREKLDNLNFAINCNLQRLDGPVRGNGKIVQELERIFRGAGWNVVKCLWGSGWDPLFAADHEGALRGVLNRVVDGDMQRFMHFQDEEVRKELFGRDDRALALFDQVGGDGSDLLRGGHDPVKIHSAFKSAMEHRGQPTVILFQTVKGWGLGPSFEGSNPTHQMKKLSTEQRSNLRDRLDIPLTDKELEKSPFYHPGADSDEVQYLLEHRRALHGFLPSRKVQIDVDLVLPEEDAYANFYQGSKGRETSTTMACVGIMTKLLDDKSIGPRIVPIVPDESRTFGMESLFAKVGIYSPVEQAYEPVDRKSLMYYKEKLDGQLLQEGINEAGAMASFTAAGTAYATQGQPMIPFYIYYSMFGFQRTGDLAWSFADARGRGFLLGATAGRTSLNGEGLQHEDGHSHVLATTFPNLRAYDPAFAYEIAAIIKDGLQRMIGDDEDVFYYLTIQNDNYVMPEAPDLEDLDEKIVKGLYLLKPAAEEKAMHVQLFGSAVMINAALEAQEILEKQFKVSSNVWSVTSYQQLRNEALAVERQNRFHPKSKGAPLPYVTEELAGHEGPIIAVTDYMKSTSDQISRFVPNRFIPLGTDGFGMSDTREALREHFEVDAHSVVLAALDGLRLEGQLTLKAYNQALKKLDVDPDKIDPLSL